MIISNFKFQISNFLRHPLFSGSVLMIGGNMIVNVVNYLYHIIMGRLLGPVDYGVLASLYSILYIVSIVPMSTSVSIVKFISSAQNEVETVSAYRAISELIFYVAAAFSAVVIILSPPIADFLHITNFWTVSLVGPIVFLSLITLINQATSQGLLRFLGLVGPNLISAVVKLLAGVTLVFLGWSVFGAMLGVVLAVLLAYFYSSWFLKRLLKHVKTGKYDLKPFLKYSLPVLLSALAFTSLFTTDVILVKHFLPAFEAGLYAALSTLGKIIYFAASPVAATMFPIVSGRKARGQGFLKVFFASLAITVLTSLGVVAFYFLFPNIAIGLLYGKAYLAAGAGLVWMGIFMFFYTLSFLFVNFMLSVGITKVVVFPLFASFLQIALIWRWHGSILQVIWISGGVVFLLFSGLSLNLAYNLLKKNHEKA